MQQLQTWFGAILDTPPYRRGGLLPSAPVLLALLAAAGAMGMFVAVGGEIALPVCVSILVGVFVLLDFRIGVILLMLLLPISASTYFPHAIGGVKGLNPLNLLLAATIVAAVVRGTRYTGQFSLFIPKPLLWLYLVPIGIAAFVGSGYVDRIPDYFFDQELLQFEGAGGYLRDVFVRPIFLVVGALLIAAAVAQSKDPEQFLVPILLSVWVMCLFAIGFVVTSGASLSDLAGTRAREFLSPIGIHANDLGRLYGFAYALLIFTLAETTDKKIRLVLLGSMLLVMVALTLTFSRGAFFGFGVANLLFLMTRRSLTGWLVGAFLLALLVVVAPGAVMDRITMGWGSNLNTISAGRIDNIWIPLLPELLNSPIYGNGLGSIMWSEAMRKGHILMVTHPHNAYLQAALDLGFAGLALLLGYFIHVWNGFRRLARDPTLSPMVRGFFAGATAGLISLMLAAFSGGSMAPANEQMFLWLVIGLMYGYQRRLRMEK